MNSVALIGRLTADPTVHAGEKHESATFRIDALEAEDARLRAVLSESRGTAA